MELEEGQKLLTPSNPTQISGKTGSSGVNLPQKDDAVVQPQMPQQQIPVPQPQQQLSRKGHHKRVEQQEATEFKKGHKRSRSMPSHSHQVDNRQASRQANDANESEHAKKRLVMRHRHILVVPPANQTQRTTTTAGNKAAAASSSRKHPPPDFDVIEVLEEEEKSYQGHTDDEGNFVPITEAELMQFPGMDHAEMELDGEDDEEAGDHRSRRHKRFWQLNWTRVHFTGLPAWLQDNEFLHSGHRPELGTFGSCFKSIFALHTETGNIWTHMYGTIAFVGIFVWLLSRPANVLAWPDKAIFSAFFAGAILCMGLSFAFHTVQCHSENVGRLFSKLDYAGISLLIIGSFVPWLYYAFYCRALAMSIYIGMIVTLGLAAIVISLWEKFAAPKFRALRGAVFLAMGLSSVVPALHLIWTDGLVRMFREYSLHWLILMGALYIIGAAVYMARFPERCFPGKCDILCQSHQLFHLFVLFAACVHYHGILSLAKSRLEAGSCSEQLIEEYNSDESQVHWLEDTIRPY